MSAAHIAVCSRSLFSAAFRARSRAAMRAGRLAAAYDGGGDIPYNRISPCMACLSMHVRPACLSMHRIASAAFFSAFVRQSMAGDARSMLLPLTVRGQPRDSSNLEKNLRIFLRKNRVTEWALPCDRVTGPGSAHVRILSVWLKPRVCSVSTATFKKNVHPTNDGIRVGAKPLRARATYRQYSSTTCIDIDNVYRSRYYRYHSIESIDIIRTDFYAHIFFRTGHIYFRVSFFCYRFCMLLFFVFDRE